MAIVPAASPYPRPTASLVIETPHYGQRVSHGAEINVQGLIRTTGHVTEISVWLNGYHIGAADLTGERCDPTDTEADVPALGFRFMFVPRTLGAARVVFRALVTACPDDRAPPTEFLGMLHLIVEGSIASARPHGSIDYCGYSRTCKGWLIGGWMPDAPSLAQFRTVHGGTGEICFTDLRLRADNCSVALVDRPDIDDPGCGFVIFIAAEPHKTGDKLTCALHPLSEEGVPLDVELRASALTTRLADPVLATRARDDLRNARPSHAAASLHRLLAQQAFFGESTLDRLHGIHMAVDESISCQNGVLLIGWMFDPCREIDLILLHHDTDCAIVPIEQMVRTERRDVAKALEETRDTVDPTCGFVTFVPVPDFAGHRTTTYIEVRAKSGARGYQTIPESKLSGIAAIRRVCGAFTARYGDVNRILGLLGPAIAQLNSERLAVPVGVTEMQFGVPPPTPVCSVIVPVHGRCEFVEDQMALFSRTDLSGRYQFIYVLDDPPRKLEFLRLCESVFNRFQVPMTVLLLAENVGFAPATNAGLAKSRGEFICFLNSDVFPGDDDWLDGLIRRLCRDSAIGAIGPLLVFEDDTVQHCGMTFERLLEFGNLPFPLHISKGFMPKECHQVTDVTAISGACMVMRRSLAETMGGFDESFIVGDFEDADLCLRIRQAGYTCAIDPGLRLYHLERQSHATSRALWRMNLTLYNAWIHAARWGSMLDGETEVAATGNLRMGSHCCVPDATAVCVAE